MADDHDVQVSLLLQVAKQLRPRTPCSKLAAGTAGQAGTQAGLGNCTFPMVARWGAKGVGSDDYSTDQLMIISREVVGTWRSFCWSSLYIQKVMNSNQAYISAV